MPAALDVRLVPAALAAWAATAAAITWCVWPFIASGCAVVAAGWALAGWRLGGRYPVLRTFRAGMVGAAAVGIGFGLAAGLRSEAALHHPLSQRFGDTAWVTVAAEESPRSVGRGRLMFRGRLLRFQDSETTGSVTVFAAGTEFSELTAGQPVRLRARISRPRRHDLTVAVLTVVGRPEFARAGVIQRAAQSVRNGFAALAREALPADQAAILPGLVLGDTAMLDATTADEFRTAGLTHLRVRFKAWNCADWPESIPGSAPMPQVKRSA